jgi:pimeloyl-ACP methyl ester carboxylesterase
VGVVRAVALAVAAAPSVLVRPSSREGVLAPLLLAAIRDAGRVAGFELSDELEPSPGDHVHVYGRRETIAAIAVRCGVGVTVRGHGPGFGVALVDGSAEQAPEHAGRLSWDIVAFDQRGCLSPRLAFVEGSAEDASRFAELLAGELALRDEQVPRGALSDDERRAASLYAETSKAVGTYRSGASFAVGLDVDARAVLLPPTGRHIHVLRFDDADALERLLGPHRDMVTCIGVTERSAYAESAARLAPGARILPLGNMQCPPLDGPVDLREML